jgi:hypothetical protein
MPFEQVIDEDVVVVMREGTCDFDEVHQLAVVVDVAGQLRQAAAGTNSISVHPVPQSSAWRVASPRRP